MIFKGQHQTDKEILNYISNHIDKDIERLLNAESLPMDGREVPEFDKFGVYENLAQKMNRSGRPSVGTICKWACAIALVLLNIGYLAYQHVDLSEPVYKEVCALRGERLVVLLEDGTRVWLNADSKLVYPERFTKDKREVSLVGEAYFEVKKDASKPFMVQADEMNIRVTGTRFNVSVYPTDSTVTTTLDEGGIVISYPYAEKMGSYHMIPGQTAIYEKGSNICKVMTNAYYKEASDWKDNKLIFRNAPLGEVLTTLSRQFDVSFDVRSKEINKFTYNFTCKLNNLSGIFEMMSAITPIKFNEISENVYAVKEK
ncbi:MAG TPA: FecR domain-containing protein [Candidatus Barnesiella excrementigallinarum]|nr:FecR domain-containing protein [Candidatus Barnesiella excrementigallinarum]